FQPAATLAEDLRAGRWPAVLGERRDWSAGVVAGAEAAGTVGLALTGDADEPLARVTAGDHRAPPDARAAALGAGDAQTVLQLLSSGPTGTPRRISLSRQSVDDMIEQTIAQYELAGPAADTVSIMP